MEPSSVGAETDEKLTYDEEELEFYSTQRPRMTYQELLAEQAERYGHRLSA